MPRTQAPEAPYSPATMPEGHIVVRLGPPQGSSNFVCTDPEGVERLVEMPNKVKRVSFAARGMFAFVRLFAEPDSRLIGEITHVITAPEIKSWRKAGEWPKAFDIETNPEPEPERDGSDTESLPENPNRRRQVVSDSESEEEDSDDE